MTEHTENYNRIAHILEAVLMAFGSDELHGVIEFLQSRTSVTTPLTSA